MIGRKGRGYVTKFTRPWKVSPANFDYTLPTPVQSDNSMMNEVKTQGLEAWVTRLSKAELPVLTGVMRDINRLTSGSDTSVNQLSEVILKDAGLTAKVLRLANSVHFNPQPSQDVTTISRAVVKLGFRGIKAICLSVMLIDSLLKKGSKQRMLEWLARGFHAAVQAEQLVAGRDASVKEDVFVAALLLHLGDMAFWSCRGSEMGALEHELGSSAGGAAQERAVLGTTLREVTQAMAELWELGPTLKEALSDADETSLAARAVRLGEEVSMAAEQGWHSEALEAVLDKVAAFSGQTRDEARQMLLRGAEEAAGVAVSYGANKLCNYIPSTADADSGGGRSSSRANPQLQLSILRELATMIQEHVDANTMFQMVVEGVHRGVGFERVALCLVDPKKKILQAKYALGDNGAEWREALRFSIRSEQDNLLAYCLHSRQVLRMSHDQPGQLKHLRDSRTAALVDINNCVLAAMYAGQRQVGVLLADRGLRGDAIEQDQYESFCHFAQQANMGLAMLASQNQGRR